MPCFHLVLCILFMGWVPLWPQVPGTHSPGRGGARPEGQDCECSAAETGGLSLYGAGRREAREALPSLEHLLDRPDRGYKAELDLFVMSLCPYGMEAERVLLPLVERFGGQVEFNLHFIADEVGAAPAPSPGKPSRAPERAGCAASGTSGEGPFSSLHGQEEIDESRRQLVLHADHPERFRAYVLCRSRQGPGGDWRLCARAAGLAPDSLQAAALSRRGEELFRADIRLAHTLAIDLSPTLLVDGEEFSDPFAPLALARRICRRQPELPMCQGLPACGRDADCNAAAGQLALCLDPDTPQARCTSYEPVAFGLTVLNTAACALCKSDDFLRRTLKLFPRAQVSTFSLESPPGEKLARRYGIETFPAYIFTEEFARSPRFGRLRHLVRKSGDSYVVTPRLAGASYWPGRPRQPGRLDIFAPAAALQKLAEGIRTLWRDAPPEIRTHPLMPEQRSALADTLQLAPDELSVLVDNRLLLRRVRPRELAQWRQEGQLP